MKVYKKIISAILTSALSASCLGNIMVYASTNSEVSSNLYTEDFNDNVIKWNNSGKNQFEFITDEGTNNVYLKIASTSNGGTNTFGIGLPEMSEGKYRIKFDYMTNDTSNKSWVTLERQYLTRPANEYLSILGALKGKYCAFTDSDSTKILGDIEAGVWYTQEVILDVDTHEASAVLYKQGSNTPVGSYKKVLETTEWSYYEWPNTVASFDNLRFRNGAECYVDNIQVDKLNKNNIIIFIEDYEDVTSDIMRGTGSIITENSNKYMHMQMSASSWNTTAFTHSIPKLSEGRIEISYDYMTNATSGQSYIVLANSGIWASNEWLRLLGVSGNNFNAFNGSTSLGTVNAGQWYTYKAIIDMKTHDVQAAIYNKGESTPIKAVSATLPVTENAYSDWPATSNEFVQFKQYGDRDAYIDNIVIKQLPANDPDVIFRESYDELAYKAYKGTGNLITDTETGNKYMHMDMTIDGVNDWGATAFAYTIPELKTGKYQIKFDYMTENISDQAYVALGNNSYYTPREWLRLLGATKTGEFSALKNTNNFGNIEAGQWYTQYVTVDMDTKEAAATIYKKGETTPIASAINVLERNNDYLSDWSETAQSFVRILYYGADDAYIDDIEIKKLPKDESVIFEENYEDPIFTPINSGSGEIVTEDSGNKYMKMAAGGPDGGWNNTQFRYAIPEISSGKICVEFDYLEDSAGTQSYFILSDSSFTQKEWLRLLGEMGYKAFTAFNSNELLGGGGTVVTGQWYSYKAIIDMDTFDVSAELYKKGEDTAIGSYTTKLERSTSNYTDWPATATLFNRFGYFGYGYGGVDNIKISHIYETPVLDSDSITIKIDDENIQEIWTEVNPSAKIIDIDFGTIMDEDTMNSDYIYVTKKDSEDKILSEITYKNGVATITATDNWASGTYTIHVSADVANPAGITLGDDFKLDFTVVGGNVSATIVGVFTGENLEKMIYEYSELKVGDELTLSVMFENATGSVSTAKFLVAYYNNEGNLINVSGNDISISADSFSNQNLTHTVKEFGDATSMKFFVWEDYSTISPLGESYSI